MSRTGPVRRITALAFAFTTLALITSVTIPKLDGSRKEPAYAAAPSLITELGIPAFDAQGKDSRAGWYWGSVAAGWIVLGVIADRDHPWVTSVATALALDADGARHPATASSVLVAVAIVLGGPLLLATVRRRAVRNGGPA